jgi:hypothetical protein
LRKRTIDTAAWTSSHPFVGLPHRSDVIWLEPTLRAEVSFAEIVADRLRAPVFRRFV